MTRIGGGRAALRAAFAGSLLAFAFAGTASGAEPSALPDIATAHARLLAHAANVSFGGGSVMHSERVHIIYWAPSGASLSFDPGYEDEINTFLARAAAASHSTGNVFGLMGQYGNAGGPAAYDMTFAGALTDTDPLPTDSSSTCTEPLPPPLDVGPPGWTACVDDAAIQAEIARVVQENGLPTGLRDMYLLATPNGLGNCFDTGPENCALGGDKNQGYCGYHSSTGGGGGEILYGVIPYNAVTGHCQSDNPRPNGSTADPTISTVAHEVAEIATDPVSDGWSDGAGNEIADLCITNYGPNLGGSSGSTAYDQVIDGGHYYIQELWSNFSRDCEPAARPDVASISAPAGVAGDRTVQFTSHASDPEGAVRGYSWSFGDGHGASRPDPSHVFLAARTVTVTLRITDSWGNWTSATRVLRVRRPRPPGVTVSGARVGGTRVTLWFGSNAAIATFQCRLGRGSWVRCRSPFRARGLSPGRHRIYIRARDTFRQLGRPRAYTFTAS